MRYRNNFFFAGFLSVIPPSREIFKVVLHNLTSVRTFSRTEAKLEIGSFRSNLYGGTWLTNPSLWRSTGLLSRCGRQRCPWPPSGSNSRCRSPPSGHHQVVGHQDGRQLLEGPGGVHAQEDGQGVGEGGGHDQVLVWKIVKINI